MNCYKTDLHIHSVLSPCGDLDMSPTNIVKRASELGLEIIGLTDHNSTKQCYITRKLGKEAGILVLCGAEVTSIEEIHCLCFFEKDEELNNFQQFLNEYLPKIPNDETRFGYQLVVNENEEIVEEEEDLLISAINIDLDNLYDKVKSLNGLFIPAHVNKPANSLISQLGFVPPDIKADALEISKHITKSQFLKKNAYLKRFSFIQSSDAHYLYLMGETFCYMHLAEPSFAEVRKALHQENGRFVEMMQEL